MLASQPTNIDTKPTGLDYWVRRATSKRESHGESHFTYKGVSLVVHPKRAAELALEGRSVLLDPSDDYKGRGWLERFVGDIEGAATTLLEGGGEEAGPSLGESLRAEIERLGQGGEPSVDPDREWWLWLTAEELPIALGCWMHQVGVMSMKYTITRQAKLGFYPTNDEFHFGAQACQTRTLWFTFQRLALARRDAAKGE